MKKISIPVTIIAEKDNQGLYTITIWGAPPWHWRSAGFPNLVQAWRGLECIPERLTHLIDQDSGRHRAKM